MIIRKRCGRCGRLTNDGIVSHHGKYACFTTLHHTDWYNDFFIKKKPSGSLNLFMRKFKGKINTWQWMFLAMHSTKCYSLPPPPLHSVHVQQIQKKTGLKYAKHRYLLNTKGMTGWPSLQISKHKDIILDNFILLCALHPHTTCVECFLNLLKPTSRWTAG